MGFSPLLSEMEGSRTLSGGCVVASRAGSLPAEMSPQGLAPALQCCWHPAPSVLKAVGICCGVWFPWCVISMELLE